MATANFGNVQQRGSRTPLKKARRMYLVRQVADDGTDNVIDATSAGFLLDEAYLTARLTDIDVSKRWYDMGLIDDVNPTRADNVTQETGSGQIFQIRDGVHRFEYMVHQVDVTAIDAYTTAKCASQDFAVFIVDECKNILVEEIVENKGYPIKLAPGTYAANFNFPNETTVNNIMIAWNIDKSVDFRRLNILKGGEVVTADILNPKGLYSAIIANRTAITTTGFNADILFETGGMGLGNREPVLGLVTADFSLDEITPTPGNIVVTVTDNGNGNYSFAYSLQTSGDVLELTSLAPMLTKRVEIINSKNKRITIP